MVSELIVSYSRWFFILPIPTFAFCNSGSGVGTPVGERQGKKVVDCLNLLYILGGHVSHFLPERVHIFPSVLFITEVPTEALLVALNIPGQAKFSQLS